MIINQVVYRLLESPFLFMRNLSRKNVLTDDGHKLGQTVNLLVDLYYGDIDLIVFPHLVTKLVRDHAGNISGQITGAAVSTLKQFIPGIELAEMVVDQAGGYAGMRAGGKVKRLMNVVQESYYIVPLRFLERTEQEDQLLLNIDHNDCKKWCLNVIPVPEVQMSFYPASDYTRSKRPVPITINSAPIQNKILEDAAGIQTFVKDILIDDRSKDAKGLVVNDPRNGLDRMIKVADISFRDERIITKSRLEEYPRI